MKYVNKLEIEVIARKVSLRIKMFCHEEFGNSYGKITVIILQECVSIWNNCGYVAGMCSNLKYSSLNVFSQEKGF